MSIIQQNTGQEMSILQKNTGQEMSKIQKNHVADPDPGFGIRCLFDPGSGIGFFRIPDLGYGSANPDSYRIYENVTDPQHWLALTKGYRQSG
jgi:hypothetical protein